MRIRPEQIETMKSLAIANFEQRTIKHLRTYLAEQTCEQTDEQLRLRIRSCVPRAGEYGLKSQKEIISFVDCTYLVGERFDTDPRYPEFNEILNQQDSQPVERAGTALGMAWGIVTASKIKG